MTQPRAKRSNLFTYIFLISLLLINLPANATKQLGSTDGGSRFVGYLNHTEYKIQTDNEISFVYHYQDNSEKRYDKIPVFPNGMIIIPELKETLVKNMVSSDLKKLIQDKLKLKAIDIFIYRVANNISVLGEVNSPGSYPMKNLKTVYDGIAKAGGFSKLAKQSKVKLIRQKLDGTRIAYIINFPKEVFNAYEPGSGVGEEIYILQEGDLIYVPGSIPKKIGQFSLKVLSAASFGVFTGLASNVFD